MSITLTEKAATRAHGYLAKNEQAKGLRLGVRKGEGIAAGCA